MIALKTINYFNFFFSTEKHHQGRHCKIILTVLFNWLIFKYRRFIQFMMGKPFTESANAGAEPSAPTLDQIAKCDLSFVDFVVNGRTVR